jgi:uncharacterized protein (UPF0332 family)
VKPETARFLDKARNLIARAETMLSVDLSEDAARAAYLAGYNAARALLFEHRDHVYTSHGGVQREFVRLTKKDERVDPPLRAFLSDTYDLKTIADYGSDPGLQVSAERARDVIQMARRFIECIASLIPPDAP